MAGIHFDKQDHELLRIVNDVLARAPSRKSFKSLLVPYLHPNGIKEMAAPKELRIAHAVINLLDVLEVGGADERLMALRSVRDEVLHCARSELRNNTGRVLLQIMKELVRSKSPRRQLELAHDFRTAATGKPRVIRSQLRLYHLLEMPEAWNQVTFDGHVHDANTKGRKSPTHLIMDAWIKGIRSLTVIYYNHIRQAAAAELLEAAEIMGVEARIGIEFSTRFRGRYVQLIWSPRGFSGTQEFIEFLSQPEVSELMSEGREVSDYQQRYVFQVLESFNRRHRPILNARFGLDVEPLSLEGFLAFIGTGQASMLHLAKYVHDGLMPAMHARMTELRDQYKTADAEQRARLRETVNEMDSLDSYTIQQEYLSPSANPDLPPPDIPSDEAGIPALLHYSPCGLVDRLTRLHASYHITVNLTDIQTEDLIELLYGCQGHITHIELFNLKDHVQQKTAYVPEINELQLAINEGNVLRLKKLVRDVLRRVEQSADPAAVERVEKMREILHRIGTLCDYYRDTPLRSLIGSDSTGRSATVPGMGLAIRETLPPRAQRELVKGSLREWVRIPVRRDAYLRITYFHAYSASSRINALYRLARNLPGLRLFGMKRREDWVADNFSTRLDQRGNVISLGGVRTPGSNGLTLDETGKDGHDFLIHWEYLNTGLKNTLKILLGFIPAFLSFALTKDWWLLAYFGAVIWFAVTGLRNIIQSVMGGGGTRRSPLLHWKSYVSWDRLVDSLMFTGFSVPLLDYFIKTMVLDQTFGVNTTTAPFILYSVMALANGIYISTHNFFRGLPPAAVYGNFFRTLLSIPLALAFNFTAAWLLGIYGAVGIQDTLQRWAAIISKAASDCVAGVIEGMADRYRNLSMRTWDYSGKLKQVFDSFARLELLFPESDVAEMLTKPEDFIKAVNMRSPELARVTIVNALDLLYFYNYQPRAATALSEILKTMSDEERRVVESSQFVLQLNHDVSRMFVDGLVGNRFGKALAFYLDRWEQYLAAFHRLTKKTPHTIAEKPPYHAIAFEHSCSRTLYPDEPAHTHFIQKRIAG